MIWSVFHVIPDSLMEMSIISCPFQGSIPLGWSSLGTSSFSFSFLWFYMFDVFFPLENVEGWIIFPSPSRIPINYWCLLKGKSNIARGNPSFPPMKGNLNLSIEFTRSPSHCHTLFPWKFIVIFDWETQEMMNWDLRLINDNRKSHPLLQNDTFKWIHLKIDMKKKSYMKSSQLSYNLHCLWDIKVMFILSSWHQC